MNISIEGNQLGKRFTALCTTFSINPINKQRGFGNSVPLVFLAIVNVNKCARGGGGGGMEARGLCNKIQFQTIRIPQAPKTMLHSTANTHAQNVQSSHVCVHTHLMQFKSNLINAWHKRPVVAANELTFCLFEPIELQI